MVNENMLSKKSKEYLDLAKEIAKKYGDYKVDTDHLLLAFLSDKESPLYKIIEKRGIDTKNLREQIVKHLQQLYDQINKAVESEAKRLIDLRAEIIRLKSDLSGIENELKSIEAEKKRLYRALQEAKRWGDWFEEQSISLELQRLESMEASYKAQLKQVEESLSQIFDREAVRKLDVQKFDIGS